MRKARILAYIIKGLLKILLMTCKIEVNGIAGFIKAAHTSPCILMLWHNRLLIVGYFLSKYIPQLTYSAFVSKSRDGEILAQFATSYPNGKTIRVAHNARDQALRNLIQRLKTKEEIIIITPDGPKGPKYEMKQGIVKAAMSSGAYTVPWSWKASHFWQLKTWDMFMIPKPFSTIQVHFGEPLLAAETLEETHERFKAELDLVSKKS